MSIPNNGVPKRIAPHPGEYLREILSELGITQTTFHERTSMSMQRISEIINGKRGVTPDTAWVLGAAFGQSPKFWLNLQATHDLTTTRPKGPLAVMPEAVNAAG